jgi:predicted metal-binding membrane protein
MAVAASAATPTRRAVPKVIVAAIATAWAVAIAVDLSGASDVLHHDALIPGALPFVGGLALFIVAWQLMIVAMMLPSSLPLVRMFRVVSVRQANPRQALTGLLAGYAAVWTGFGVAAFVVDIGVHRTVDAVPWLQARPQLIAASALLLAGAFQFTDLKDRCLRECRHPGPFLMTRYQRGGGAALRLGISHGLFCLGCCWALMLVGFAAGVANLWWMAMLTAVMVYEKTARHGDRIVAPVGLALLAAGLLMLL